jgi:antitoxin PrlF
LRLVIYPFKRVEAVPLVEVRQQFEIRSSVSHREREDIPGDHEWRRRIEEPGVLDKSSWNSYYPGMKSVVSEKGQVTIPKRLREKLGLRPGQVLEFETKNGVLLGRKALSDKNPVDAVRGVLGRMDVDAELAKMRGKPWNAADDRPRAKRR